MLLTPAAELDEIAVSRLCNVELDDSAELAVRDLALRSKCRSPGPMMRSARSFLGRVRVLSVSVPPAATSDDNDVESFDAVLRATIAAHPPLDAAGASGRVFRGCMDREPDWPALFVPADLVEVEAMVWDAEDDGFAVCDA